MTDTEGAVVLYVAGPVTGRENRNLAAFEEAERALYEAGFWPSLPHRAVPKDADWEDAMGLSVTLMLGCDGVALLPDWRESPGARIEARIAEDAGMPVREVDEWCREARAGGAR